MPNGELTKVRLEVYQDDLYQNRIGVFDLPINPEQFSQALTVKYDSKQPAGSQHSDLKYELTQPEQLKLDFTLDGTGVVPNKQEPGKFHTDIVGQLQEFIKLTYTMNPETHKPNFLRLLWGNFSFGDSKYGFECVLSDLDIKYTLFGSDGKPLRAKLSANFTGYIEHKLRLLEENKKSADLTHQRKVTAGDTLPLMTYRIYGDPSYYLQIAKVNGLVNFRRLATKTDLRFPPLEKTEV